MHAEKRGSPSSASASSPSLSPWSSFPLSSSSIAAAVPFMPAQPVAFGGSVTFATTKRCSHAERLNCMAVRLKPPEPTQGCTSYSARHPEASKHDACAVGSLGSAG